MKHYHPTVPTCCSCVENANKTADKNHRQKSQNLSQKYADMYAYGRVVYLVKLLDVHIQLMVHRQNCYGSTAAVKKNYHPTVATCCSCVQACTV